VGVPIQVREAALILAPAAVLILVLVEAHIPAQVGVPTQGRGAVLIQVLAEAHTPAPVGVPIQVREAVLIPAPAAVLILVLARTLTAATVHQNSG